jgi:hypothetical protein
MRRFTSAVRQTLAAENWVAALYLAVTLPDICARLESNNQRSNGKRYAAWFDRFVGHRYLTEGDATSERRVFLAGNDAYALRCAVLHEGSPDITRQHAREVLTRFHFTVARGHCNWLETVLHLDVPTYCTDLCDGVEVWAIEFPSKYPDKAARLLDLLVIHTGPSSPIPGVLLG